MAGSSYREFDFGLGEVIDAVRDQVQRFAQQRIAPRANEIDRSNVFPRDLWRELGDLGLLGMTVSRITAVPASDTSPTRLRWRKSPAPRRRSA
jgi:hypothetical protein